MYFICRPDKTKPVIEEFRVFPIPNPEHHEKILNEKWRHPIPYSARSPLNAPQMLEIYRRLAEETKKIDHILEATTGYIFVYFPKF